MTKEEILEIIEAEGVEFIRLQFTDIFGNLKNVAVPARNIERVMDNKFILMHLQYTINIELEKRKCTFIQI